MKILRGAPKTLRHPKVGASKQIVGLGVAGGGGWLRILYTSKPTRGIVIQIGWISTQQFNHPCN